MVKEVTMEQNILQVLLFSLIINISPLHHKHVMLPTRYVIVLVSEQNGLSVSYLEAYGLKPDFLDGYECTIKSKKQLPSLFLSSPLKSLIFLAATNANYYTPDN
jgi:hypothetical protein